MKESLPVQMVWPASHPHRFVMEVMTARICCSIQMTSLMKKTAKLMQVILMKVRSHPSISPDIDTAAALIDSQCRSIPIFTLLIPKYHFREVCLNCCLKLCLKCHFQNLFDFIPDANCYLCIMYFHTSTWVVATSCRMCIQFESKLFIPKSGWKIFPPLKLNCYSWPRCASLTFVAINSGCQQVWENFGNEKK